MKENDVFSDSSFSTDVLLVCILNEARIFIELNFFFDEILIDLDLNSSLRLFLNFDLIQKEFNL